MLKICKYNFLFLLFADLQLAAELGRTLLERNEELETELKQQQVVIDDQAQEIEVCNKHNILNNSYLISEMTSG